MMTPLPVVRAAGGLLWRPDPAGARVAVVHRPRRSDWTLPKGKLDGGESFEEAALREVEEETGCAGRITGFAGATSYLGRKVPKLVLYWHMALVREGEPDAGDEVDEVAWLTPAEAIPRLSYEADRRLLARAAAGPRGPAGPSPAAVAAERADLLRRVLALGPRAEGTGLGPALELLDEADQTGDPRDVRALVLAARRLALLSAEPSEVALRADALRAEARRLAPWRRRAIRRVLADARDPTPEALHVAAAIRDEEDDGLHGEATGGRAGLVAAGALGAAAALVLLSAALLPALRSALLAGGAAGAVGGAAVVAAVASSGIRRRRGR